MKTITRMCILKGREEYTKRKKLQKREFMLGKYEFIAKLYKQTSEIGDYSLSACIYACA